MAVTTPLTQVIPPQLAVFPVQNCTLGVEPEHCHPDLPREEGFREAAKSHSAIATGNMMIRVINYCMSCFKLDLA